ncbi:MAG: urease accessory UreF family protein [Granulosicoccus sp.]
MSESDPAHDALSTLSLLRLQSWMSPAFPTGAYACSHGIETAIAERYIYDATSCQSWILDILQYGSGWNDAVFLKAAWTASSKADPIALAEHNDLALALQAGQERWHETTQLAASFLRASEAWQGASSAGLNTISGPLALPVVIGAFCAAMKIPLKLLLPTFLQTNSSNLIWIATRLVPLGQSDALRIIANLESVICTIANRAAISCLDDLGSSALLADIVSLRHEQLASRVCIT